jgi:hypothetical protein
MAEPVHGFFTRYLEAIASRNFTALEQMFHPEYVGIYPQSGERIRGFASLRQQMERYPGGLDAGDLNPASARLIGDEERWVISPGYTVLPLAGPERYTTIGRTRYPDGSMWWVIGIVELKDGKIYRSESYFAPDFDPPEWRRDLVEIVPRDE